MTFAKGWWSFDLGDVRECDGTYELYPWESLPPLDLPADVGAYRWLGSFKAKGKLPKLFAAAEAAGVLLPQAFVTFFSLKGAAACVPSCTACEWDLSDAPIPSAVEAGAYFIRFLRDQQDCLFWYLYLPPAGEAYVVCSPIPLGEVDEPADVVVENTWWVSPSFEAFLYRWWLENVLWDKVDDDAALTEVESAYLSHYATQD